MVLYDWVEISLAWIYKAGTADAVGGCGSGNMMHLFVPVYFGKGEN